MTILVVRGQALHGDDDEAVEELSEAFGLERGI